MAKKVDTAKEDIKKTVLWDPENSDQLVGKQVYASDNPFDILKVTPIFILREWDGCQTTFRCEDTKHNLISFALVRPVPPAEQLVMMTHDQIAAELSIVPSSRLTIIEKVQS
jgi:hypothetical protein